MLGAVGWLNVSVDLPPMANDAIVCIRATGNRCRGVFRNVPALIRRHIPPEDYRDDIQLSRTGQWPHTDGTLIPGGKYSLPAGAIMSKVGIRPSTAA